MAMYELLVGMQYVGIVLLLVEIAMILYNEISLNKALMLMFSICALINTVGYLLQMQARSMEAAMYAVKFTYFGKPFLILSMFFFVLNYCRVKCPKWIISVLYIFHAMIPMLVLHYENNTLFYTKVEYTTEGLFPHLILSHGIVYNLFMVMVAVFSVVMVYNCIKRLKVVRDHNEKMIIYYLMLIIGCAVLSIILYASGVTDGYDVTALGYVICATIIAWICIRYNLFGTLKAAQDSVLDNMSDGVMVLNNSQEVLYSNNQAEKVYPQIMIANEQENVVDEIHKKMEKHEKIFRDSDIYTIKENQLVSGKTTLGSVLVIENVTDDYNYKQRLEFDVKEKTKEIEHIQHAIITGIANMVEARDDVTGTHIKNTSQHVKELCYELYRKHQYLGILNRNYIETLVNAAPLHDIGKIAIPDAILQKPGPLTEEEFAIIKTHSQVGAKLLDEIIEQAGNDETLMIARDMAHYHHERWDGKGYPSGLAGEEIPLCARIMAVADVYDALISMRSYKEPFSLEKAEQIIREGAGTQFDPIVVEAFLQLVQGNSSPKEQI